MDGTALTVAVVNGGFGLTAAVLAGRATMHGRRNAVALHRVEAQTKRQFDKRIEHAVRQVFADNPSAVTEAIVAEALRDLLEMMQDTLDNDERESKHAQSR